MTVSEARIELSNLQDQHADLQRRLELAIEHEDVDPSVLMNFKKELQMNATKQYVARARIMRLEKQEHVNDREAALSERVRLEEDLKVAAKELADALKIADDKAVEYQRISMQLGILDNRVDSNRVEIGLKQKQLGEQIARWRQDALLVEGPCDL